MRYFLGLLVFTVVAACATNPEPKYVWQNPSVSNAELQWRWSIDDAECDAQAYQQVALPNLPQGSSYVPQGYTSKVDIQSQSSQGYSPYSSTSYQGTITTTPGDGSYASSFLQGMEQGRARKRARMQEEAYEEAQALRDRYADACLMKRGWQRVQKPEA